MDSLAENAATHDVPPRPPSAGKRERESLDDGGEGEEGGAKRRRMEGDPTNFHEVLRCIDPQRVGTDAASYMQLFEAVAHALVNHSILHVGTAPHRILEIEFYVNTPSHPDVQCHCEELQMASGRWYFHRKGAPFRTGTSQGVDITCGGPPRGDAPGWHGGINIRSIQQLSDGKIVCGPSLCVDHMLKLTGCASPSQLVESGCVSIADTASRLHIAPDTGKALTQERIYTSPRIGLTLRTLRDPDRYIMRPYRFLAMPDRIKKGKQHLMLQLHASGASAEEVMRVCGVPRSTYDRTLALFEEGRRLPFESFVGKNLSPDDVCRLFGAHVGLSATT